MLQQKPGEKSIVSWNFISKNWTLLNITHIALHCTTLQIGRYITLQRNKEQAEGNRLNLAEIEVQSVPAASPSVEVKSASQHYVLLCALNALCQSWKKQVH